MTEDVLQYIWQTQAFTKSNLQTSAQQVVKIFDPGSLNNGSGPDFANARIELDGMSWSGDVEIHTYASHWNQHNHDKDENYDRVVLHVVWEEDQKILRHDGTIIPTVELRNHLDQNWFERYRHLMNSLAAVPCAAYLDSVDEVIKTDTIQSALIKRLESKSAEVNKILEENKGDWYTTSLVLLFSQFGFQKNKAAFQQLAKCIDVSVLRKLTSQIQIEAYLFGLSGLLPRKSKDDHVIKLQQEYAWLDRKHAIRSKEMSPLWWKFMRMRPANFPTLRLAQLSVLLSTQGTFMRSLLEFDIEQLQSIFQVRHPEFWQRHYHFSSKLDKKITGMGLASQNMLLINVVVVLLVTYGLSIGQAQYVEKAVRLLERINPESNRITRLWDDLGISSKNAADSQGLLGLFNDYCKKSRCLSCSIGKYIVKPQ